MLPSSRLIPSRATLRRLFPYRLGLRLPREDLSPEDSRDHHPAAFLRRRPRPSTASAPLIVHHPYDGREVGVPRYATADQVERAVAAAAAVVDEAAALPAHVRAAALDHVSRRLAERADEVARLITAENGKPIKWARAEVAGRSPRSGGRPRRPGAFSGELQRLDTDPAAAGRIAAGPAGPARGRCSGISPFNFPLNLVAHKVAPAIAVGRADRAQAGSGHPAVGAAAGRAAGRDRPAGRHVLGAADAQRPRRRAGRRPRLPVVSFTGSGPVGAQIRAAGAAQARHPRAGRQRGRGDLRGLDVRRGPRLRGRRASPPSPTTRPARAASRCSGSSCTPTCMTGWPTLVAEKVAALRTGDPADEATEVGPLISERGGPTRRGLGRRGGRRRGQGPHRG